MAKETIDLEKAKRGEAVLRSLKSLKKLAQAEREEAARLREMACTGARRQEAVGEDRENRMGRAAQRLAETEERWAEDASRLAEQEARAARAMERMDARECLLLHLRWLRGLTWEGVVLRLYVCERTARRMHLAALMHFAEAYEEEEREKDNP